MTSSAAADLDGFRLLPGILSRAEQEALRDEVLSKARLAPFYIPRMPKSGAPMSVRMTNFGQLGWVTDKEGGYRYQATHPETNMPWPDMPPRVLELWNELTAYPAPPEGANLRGIPVLRDTFDVVAGLSDHTLATTVPVVAVALGASLIEKHFTMSRKEPGPDSHFSLEPREFREMVAAVRTTEAAMGRAMRTPIIDCHSLAQMPSRGRSATRSAASTMSPGRRSRAAYSPRRLGISFIASAGRQVRRPCPNACCARAAAATIPASPCPVTETAASIAVSSPSRRGASTSAARRCASSGAR